MEANKLELLLTEQFNQYTKDEKLRILIENNFSEEILEKYESAKITVEMVAIGEQVLLELDDRILDEFGYAKSHDGDEFPNRVYPFVLFKLQVDGVFPKDVFIIVKDYGVSYNERTHQIEDVYVVIKDILYYDANFVENDCYDDIDDNVVEFLRKMAEDIFDNEQLIETYTDAISAKLIQEQQAFKENNLIKFKGANVIDLKFKTDSEVYLVFDNGIEVPVKRDEFFYFTAK